MKHKHTNVTVTRLTHKEAMLLDQLLDKLNLDLGRLYGEHIGSSFVSMLQGFIVARYELEPKP